jgi:pimeloyl-ACP methyl ester carboxylesterase
MSGRGAGSARALFDIRSVCLVAALVAGACSFAMASPRAMQSPQSQSAAARAVIAAAQALPPGSIDELRTVKLGGIPQWVSIRGADPSNPILLFLHGGPGSPMMPESWTFERPWEDFFTVVQWDQRDAGKTFSAAHRIPDKSMTMAQLQSDTEQLIGWLRNRYGKRKIYLLGFSFGSILGLRIAKQHPDWLYGYIGVGQVVNAYRNEVVGYRETLAKAEAVHDRAAIEALESIAPYPNPHGPTPISKIVIERRWDVALGGMIYGRTEDDATAIWRLSPDYSPYDVQSALLGELTSVEILVPQIENVDFDADRVFKCPIFFFAGAHDRTTPETIVAAYYKTIRAPVKKFFLIEHASHYVVTGAPGEVLVDLVRYVRPLSQVPTRPR